MSWSGALLTPAPGFRRQTRRDGLATMASIDVAELGVDRQEDTIRVDLRHADQTSVSKVPPVSPDDGLDGRDLVRRYGRDLADACLVRMSEIHSDCVLLT